MSYLGKVRPVETLTVPREKYFSGDGSTVNFTLDYEPPTESALAVYIDGIRIHPDSWSFSGTTLTFASAPASGTNNIYTNMVSETGLEIIPADGSVTAAKTSGMQNIIQIVHATPYTTYSSHTTAIPADDSIPQNTEGEQILTVTITPTATTSRLLIEASFPAVSGTTASAWLNAALFQDSTANALAMTSHSVSSASATYVKSLFLRHEMAAGTTSSTTFKIRVGTDVGTMYVNGTGSSRLMGGILAARLSVMEVKP